MQVFIRAMRADDWPQVSAIYSVGIATGHATFQTEIPDWETWDKGHHAHSRLVACVGDDIVGWSALSPVSMRRVYAGVAEESIYIAENARGKGVGKQLLTALVVESERNGIWTLQTSIFPENVASVRLHESCGFRIVGNRERIGQHHGVWRDTLFLERRSKTVGF